MVLYILMCTGKMGIMQISVNAGVQPTFGKRRYLTVAIRYTIQLMRMRYVWSWSHFAVRQPPAQTLAGI